MILKKRSWIILIVLALAIRLAAFFPAAVEKYYSTALYPLIAGTQRWLFGWLPFSAGDLLYAVVVVYLLVKLCRWMAVIVRKQANRAFWTASLWWLISRALFVYVLFNLLWGLNYNRLGTAYQMGLQLKPYTTEELQHVMKVLVQRLDSTSTQSLATRHLYLDNTMLFAESYQAYQLAEKKYPHLSYHTRSVKQSLFSYLGDYMGYTGYYNPFTGEAQVNTTVPVFVQPFTTCHEMGHQLGYAKENEANFAGFLSSRTSRDAAFTYSVYFDMYNYGIRELYFRDSVQAIALNKQKPLQVRKDNLALRQFYEKYENPVEPYIHKLYGQYLKANEQPSGMQSYSEVMAFLVAYYKKFGAGAL